MHYCFQRPRNVSQDEDKTTLKQTTESQVSPVSSTTDERLVITYTCNKCSTSYRTIETFKAHTCTVPETLPEILTCDECSFSTTSKQVLQEHAETHAKTNVVFKCSLCGYHGNTMRGMKQHGRQHMPNGQEFAESHVIIMEQPAVPTRIPMAGPIPVPVSKNFVDEELLRLKNEPYKKRRSRKHYQKSEFFTSSPATSQVSPQRKENAAGGRSSSSPPSSSNSCSSPLQNSTTTILNDKPLSSPSPSSIKLEPIDTLGLPTQVPLNQTQPIHVAEKKLPPMKSHICSCNASFSSAVTFEAHKKHYCPHKETRQGSPAITVTH